LWAASALQVYLAISGTAALADACQELGSHPGLSPRTSYEPAATYHFISNDSPEYVTVWLDTGKPAEIDAWMMVLKGLGTTVLKAARAEMRDA
jgi:hypothetical protein